MYRDDRAALLARAEALQKELDAAAREGEAQKTELAAANDKLAAAKAELAALRERLAKLEPPVDRSAGTKRRSAIIVVAMGAVLLAGLAVALMSVRADAPEIPEPPVRVGQPPPPLQVKPPPPPVPMPDVTGRQAGAVASCPDAAIATALHRAAVHLDACHREHAPDFAGTASATWLLDAQGTVNNLVVVGVDRADLATCIHDEVRSARYTARSCRGYRDFTFTTACPNEVDCLLADVPPVCCVQYRTSAQPEVD